MFVLVCLCGCSNHAVPMIDSLPVLRVEEWPLPGESLTSDTVRLLIDRVRVFISDALVCCPYHIWCQQFYILQFIYSFFAIPVESLVQVFTSLAKVSAGPTTRRNYIYLFIRAMHFYIYWKTYLHFS